MIFRPVSGGNFASIICTAFRSGLFRHGPADSFSSPAPLRKGTPMTMKRGFSSAGLVLAAALWLPALPLAAQSVGQGNPGVDRYLRLDDGLYELNADGTYHKVNSASAANPPRASSPSRSAASSSGSFTGQERFMRFDDGLYERMADGTYSKADERRQMQQSQSGGYGASSTSLDRGWQQQFGPPQQWNNQPQQQWNNGRPQQWINNQPQQWNSNRPQQWNNRPQQWNNNSNQEDLRQLGQFLNALGGVIQNGGGGRPPRPSQPSFQPQPNFQGQTNVHPQPMPQAPPRPVPSPIQPPKPSPRPPATNTYIQQGGNQSLFQLAPPEAK